MSSAAMNCKIISGIDLLFEINKKTLPPVTREDTYDYFVCRIEMSLLFIHCIIIIIIGILI